MIFVDLTTLGKFIEFWLVGSLSWVSKLLTTNCNPQKGLFCRSLLCPLSCLFRLSDRLGLALMKVVLLVISFIIVVVCLRACLYLYIFNCYTYCVGIYLESKLCYSIVMSCLIDRPIGRWTHAKMRLVDLCLLSKRRLFLIICSIRFDIRLHRLYMLFNKLLQKNSMLLCFL